ncbi:MAG: glutamine synthetase III [Bacillota bacterium]
MYNIPELFNSMVFSDAVMKEKLPKDTYKALRKCMDTGAALEIDVANVVANAMKDWAVEHGATHFTHWFQPMTGVTAEKHDCFLEPNAKGDIDIEFSGKALVRGEPDASSFPSGGLRATFEARGYTAWDPTSYAFIKDGSLCIPTAFCSYSGEALDKKTPLLRSMQAIDKHAVRILRLFGNTKVKNVRTTVGAEQEYFLIDKDLYEKRMDLMNCGRTLFGARPSKGQELDDHYFGAIKTRVSNYMKDLDAELWKLGIPSKTKHNEVAPAQHELAPVFESSNIATDHNQVTMEIMKTVAIKHNLACLLHEKPFAAVNGSGKHNNWSISTDTGKNLLDPGETPYENAQFLLFLTAVIKAVDEYQDLMRVAVASAGNDHRLGANEAPPAIVSIFLGDELMSVVESLESGSEYVGVAKTSMEIGVDCLPKFPKDSTDRNRTSPFAFTGNKFEFRMLGSTASTAGPNFILNTIVAEVLNEFADKLEKTSKVDFKDNLNALIKETLKAHKRILFNGNNYSDEWLALAEERGLLNLKSTVEALPTFIAPKNIEVFVKHGVLTEAEMHSRYEILVEGYVKTLHIEALTMIDMAKREILPSIFSYENEIASILANKKAIGLDVAEDTEMKLLQNISSLCATLAKSIETLENDIVVAKGMDEGIDQAIYYRETIFADMGTLRLQADELETLVAKKYWALPSYADLLYSVK